jgi:hypothetical protein
MFEPINRKSPEDRRAVAFDPAVTAAILQGQVVSLDPATSKAVLADGAAVVPDPMWAFTKTGRLDTDIAKSVTVLEAPFSAKVDADGHDGAIADGAALAIGTTTAKGKLVSITPSSVADLQSVVAYCVKAPDSDGVMLFKAIR